MVFLWFSYGFPQLPMVKSQDFRAATSATPFPSALLLVGLEHTVGPPRRFFGFKNSQLLSAKWEMESDGDQWDQSHGSEYIELLDQFQSPSTIDQYRSITILSMDFQSISNSHHFIIQFPQWFHDGNLPLRLADRWLRLADRWLSCLKNI